jgi:hypothetical protein
MQPPAEEAVEVWLGTHTTAQEAAAQALQTAFPYLQRTPQLRNGCCPIQFSAELPPVCGGSGLVCLDDESRVTIEITGLSSRLLADALDVIFGTGWFAGDGEPLRDIPGQHGYDDDNSTQYEIALREGQQPGSLFIGYAMVPDAVEVLDALATQIAVLDGQSAPADDQDAA